jgi:hypothetical protein
MHIRALNAGKTILIMATICVLSNARNKEALIEGKALGRVLENELAKISPREV